MDRSRGIWVGSTLYRLRHILQSMRVASVVAHKHSGLSAAQLIVLQHLEAGSGLSINELAGLTVTDRSSVAEAVDRLSRRDLVERSWAVHDRRRAVVTITPQGRRALERAPLPPTVLLARALNRLPDFELQMLARGLERLTIELGIEQWKP